MVIILLHTTQKLSNKIGGKDKQARKNKTKIKLTKQILLK
jgi:hypothetical protein